MDPSCTICRQHDETVAHVLWECPLARNVWAMVKGKLQKCNSEAQNFYTLARQMEENPMGFRLTLFTCITRFAFYIKGTHVYFMT